MTDSPVDLTITRENEAGQSFVRIAAKDGLRIVACIDLSLEDFAAVLLGKEVLARFQVQK